jgi:hypothetical protein
MMQVSDPSGWPIPPARRGSASPHLSSVCLTPDWTCQLQEQERRLALMRDSGKISSSIFDLGNKESEA